MIEWFEKIVRCGIAPELRESEKRRIYILNIWNMVAACIQVPYTITAIYLQEIQGLLLNILFAVLAAVGYGLTYWGKVKLARYWMVITFPMMLMLFTLFIGRESYVLALAALMGISIPFFFDEKREIHWLGAYVLACTIAGYHFGHDPINKDLAASQVGIFAYMNLATAVGLAIVFVRILQKENTAFENSIITQNTLLSQQKEEIEAQRDQLSDMNHEISQHNQALNASNTTIAKKNKTITDSIKYAQRIQTAIMPSVHEFKATFPQSFVLYQPKDMIGGDFYWLDKVGNNIFLAVADCTGHGVPGALMSMLGANLLSQIVAHTQQPSEILAELDSSIRKQLRQDEASSDIRDGMDIAVCRIQGRALDFASAQRPVVVVTPEGLQCIKGNRNPIGSGIYEEKTFTTHHFEQAMGLYLYTDGCTDVFDATDTRKLGHKRWLQWLEDVWQLTAQQQEEILLQRLHDWAGETPPIDDKLAIYVRLG